MSRPWSTLSSTYINQNGTKAVLRTALWCCQEVIAANFDPSLDGFVVAAAAGAIDIAAMFLRRHNTEAWAGSDGPEFAVTMGWRYIPAIDPRGWPVTIWKLVPDGWIFALERAMGVFGTKGAPGGLGHLDINFGDCIQNINPSDHLPTAGHALLAPLRAPQGDRMWNTGSTVMVSFDNIGFRLDSDGFGWSK